MVNKEFIINTDGTILKDFVDRDIPQNSHNFVTISCLIPVSLFNNLNNFSVILAMAKSIDNNNWETLPSIAMFPSKTLKCNGVDYIKYQCQLSLTYTNFIGQLAISPYINTSVYDSNTDKYYTMISKTFTNTRLNVVRSVFDTQGLDYEDLDVVSDINQQLNGKRIAFIEEYENYELPQVYYEVATNYTPSGEGSYEGYLFMIKHKDGNFVLYPYMNEDAVEFTKQSLDGIFSHIYDIEATTENDETSYSYEEEQLTLSKTFITDALATKVDKTTKVNNHPLDADVVVTKGDVGLGKVKDYDVVDAPNPNADEFYITSKGVYDYLTGNYGTPQEFASNIQKLTELYNSFSLDDGNDVVDTLKDLIDVFSNYPEADNILDALNTMRGQIASLNADTNAFVVLKNSTEPLLTIAPEDWDEQENPTYEDYPFIAQITNERFVGAKKVTIIYDVPNANSDILSSGCTLDTETGTLTIYAMEVPTDDVVIEEIDIINSLACYNLYDGQVEAQVNTNKNDISTIKGQITTINTLIGAINTSLPQYLKKQETNEPYTSTISHDGDSFSVYINETETGLYGNMYMESGEFYVELGDSNNHYAISLTNTGDFSITNVENGTTHSVTFDTNGDLKVDGVKVESVGNLVTSFQTTPDDTHYPSEKLVKDSLDGKQNNALVTSFQSTPDNTHYPSEKLVKDSLDDKQKKFSVPLEYNANNNYQSYGLGGLTTGRMLAIVICLAQNQLATQTIILTYIGNNNTYSFNFGSSSYNITFSESYIGNNINIDSAFYIKAITYLN